MTKVTHAEQLQLDTPTNLWAYFGNTGVNKAVFYDSAGKLGIGGAATLGGAVAVPALTIDPNTAAVVALGTFAANGNASFLAGADLNGQKITSLAAGVLATDAVNLSQLTGAVSGTAGTYAMFTGTHTIGDSTFPISQSSATALTIGDDTTSDVTTINGRVVATSVNGTNHAFTFNYTPVAVTTNDNSAIYVAVGGTADTTAGVVAVNGFNVDATTTRAAGANNVITQGLRVFASGGQDVRAGRFSATGGTVSSYGVFATATATATDNYGVNASATGAGTTNYGASFSATGATTNIGLRTIAGDNYLNSTSGNTVVGYASGTAITNARFQVQNSGALLARAGYFSTSTTAATGARYAIETGTSGTYDTTAGSINAYGVFAAVTSTRSAGANNLNNIALFGNASGAQVNEALRTDDGNVRLNRLSGTTTIGFSQATASALTVSGQANFTHTGTSGNSFNFITTPAADTISHSSIANTVAGTLDTTAGLLTSAGLNVSVTTTRSAGANNLLNKSVVATATGAQINIAYQSTDGSNYFNTTSGNTGVGYASGATLSGKFNVTSASGIGLNVVSTSITQDAVQITRTPTAGTTTGLAGVRVTSNGSYDTTAGALGNASLAVFNTNLRSAGANTLTNRAIYATTTAAQVNIAIETQDGDNYFNTSSGSVGVGYASAATLPAKLSVTGTFDVTSTATLNAALAHKGTTLGFYNTAPVVKPTAAGSRGGNAALASLLTALAGQGLIIDGTTA